MKLAPLASTGRNTRRIPADQAGRGKPFAAARPENTFAAWWAWGIEQADAARDGAPIRIHTEHRPTEGHVQRQPIIMGWPFSRPFEKHADGERSRSPFVAALKTLGSPNPRQPQSHEFRIVWALYCGHTDPEIVRTVGLGSPHRAYFEAAAIRALEFVWQKAQEDLRAVVDPPAPAGAA